LHVFNAIKRTSPHPPHRRASAKNTLLQPISSFLEGCMQLQGRVGSGDLTAMTQPALLCSAKTAIVIAIAIDGKG
jgi:hypothetical protein